MAKNTPTAQQGTPKRHEIDRALRFGVVALIFSGVSVLLALYSVFQIADLEMETLDTPTDMNVSEVTSEEWNEFTAETQEEVAQARAEMRLQVVRGRILLEDSAEEINEELDEIEMDLRQVYEASGEQSQQTWQTAQADLAELRGQVESGSVDALETVERMIENLQMEIRTQ